MLRITPSISISKDELHEDFVRAPGPGGQHVNKVATAVQLRFDVAHSPSLPPDVRRRLRLMAGKRLTEEGVLIISARRYRSRERNRQDALERLTDLIRRAAVRPAKRRRTKPSPAARERRLKDKRQRSMAKQTRRPVDND